MLPNQALHWISGMPQVAIVMGCLIPIVGIVAYYWYESQQVRSDNELKRTMVERGLSVDEVERILAAHSEDPRGSRR